MKAEVGQEEPPWVEVAKREIGTREFPGAESNPKILKYYRATQLGGHPEDGSTPWCAAFVGWCLQQAGYRGTRKANARSYLDYGDRLPEPRVGCIAVLWRGALDSHQGHVAFVTAKLPHRLILLGGNQGNAVSYQEYGDGRVLDYRWPNEADRIALPTP